MMPKKRGRVRTPVGERSRTKQSFADDCDINRIVKRHERGEPITHFNAKHPTFGDFTEGQNLKEAMDSVFRAKEEFAELPARVRSAANNSPVQLLRMLDDPGGRMFLQKSGLELGIEIPKPEPAKTKPAVTEVPAAIEKTDTK